MPPGPPHSSRTLVCKGQAWMKLTSIKWGCEKFFTVGWDLDHNNETLYHMIGLAEKRPLTGYLYFLGISKIWACCIEANSSLTADFTGKSWTSDFHPFFYLLIWTSPHTKSPKFQGCDEHLKRLNGLVYLLNGSRPTNQLRNFTFSHMTVKIYYLVFMTFHCKGAHTHALRFPCWSLIISFLSVHALEVTLPVLCWVRLTRQKHSISGYKEAFHCAALGRINTSPSWNPSVSCIQCLQHILNQKLIIMWRITFFKWIVD